MEAYTWSLATDSCTESGAVIAVLEAVHAEETNTHMMSKLAVSFMHRFYTRYCAC